MSARNLLRWPSAYHMRESDRTFALNDPRLEDPREVPMYSFAEAALFVGVPRSTLRYWTKDTRYAPAPIQAADQSGRLSFANLLEAHILLSTTKRNDIPLRRIRMALETLRKQFPMSQHPLLERDLHRAPGCRDLFIRAVEGEEIINASRGGQAAFKPILERHLKRIEWDSGGPVRLFPMWSNRIVIDLNVSGAQPVVKGTGVMVSMLARRYRAGDSIAELTRDYKLKAADVKEAIEHFGRLEAA